eukprot:1467665-Pleurochrysis_carterae.AAC.9
MHAYSAVRARQQHSMAALVTTWLSLWTWCVCLLVISCQATLVPGTELVQAASIDAGSSSKAQERRHLMEHNSKNISVTQSTLQMFFEVAIQQAEDSVRNVDTSCVLRVEETEPARFCVISNAISATKQQPKCADAASGGEAVRNSALGTNELKHGMLCRIASPPSTTSSTKAASSIAVVTFVTSADYLFENWRSFLNKVSYCERTGRACYLLLGKPTSRTVLNDRPQLVRDNPASPHCEVAELSNTINIYKTLALLALFRASPNLPGAMYMDADTWFADGSDGANNAAIGTPEAYFALEPNAHLPRKFFSRAVCLCSAQLAEWPELSIQQYR